MKEYYKLMALHGHKTEDVLFDFKYHQQFRQKYILKGNLNSCNLCIIESIIIICDKIISLPIFVDNLRCLSMNLFTVSNSIFSFLIHSVLSNF